MCNRKIPTNGDLTGTQISIHQTQTVMIRVPRMTVMNHIVFALHIVLSKYLSHMGSALNETN